MITVKNLNIYFPNKQGIEHIVRKVSFNITTEKLALVGGSGSGKTLTAKALFGLVPKPGIVKAEILSVLGNNLLTMSPDELRVIRGKQIAMITQDPKYSLNPVLTIGRQIDECFRFHQGASNKQAKALTLNILAEVKITDPLKTYAKYPFQLSGGMGQRVMIAMMIAAGPKILIADEATSALDQATRDEILELLATLAKQKNMSLVMISHDLPLVANYCDRVLVMHNGSIVDSCNAKDLPFSQHPYTKRLWNSRPSLAKKGTKLYELSTEA